MWLSLIGSVLCVLVMFLISWNTALLTLLVVLALYLIVTYRKPGKKSKSNNNILYIFKNNVDKIFFIVVKVKIEIQDKVLMLILVIFKYMKLNSVPN